MLTSDIVVVMTRESTHNLRKEARTITIVDSCVARLPSGQHHSEENKLSVENSQNNSEEPSVPPS